MNPEQRRKRKTELYFVPDATLIIMEQVPSSAKLSPEFAGRKTKECFDQWIEESKNFSKSKHISINKHIPLKVAPLKIKGEFSSRRNANACGNNREMRIKKCLEHDCFSDDPTVRLNAISLLLNIGYNFSSLVSKYGLLKIILQLCQSGELDPNPNPIFRWPYATIRYFAVLSLSQILRLGNVNSYQRRWMVKLGAVNVMALACELNTKSTPKFSTSYKDTDYETKNIARACLRECFTEDEINRSISCFVLENREWDVMSKEQLHHERSHRKALVDLCTYAKQVRTHCKLFRMNPESSLEKRLLCATIETKLEPTGIIEFHESRFKLRSDFELVEDEIPSDNEEVSFDLSPEFQEAARLLRLKKKEERRRKRASEEQNEVQHVLDIIMGQVEAIDWCQCFIRVSILDDIVFPQIRELERIREAAVQAREESLFMQIEDQLYTIIRKTEYTNMLREQSQIVDEDMNGVKSRLRKLNPEERRAYKLGEEEYLRRCDLREIRDRTRTLEREWAAMEIEDDIGKKNRARDACERKKVLVAWEETVDESGTLCYINSLTKVSQFIKPSGYVSAEVREEQSALQKQELIKGSSDGDNDVDRNNEDTTWQEYYDETYQAIYYYNTITGETAWK